MFLLNDKSFTSLFGCVDIRNKTKHINLHIYRIGIIPSNNTPNTSITKAEYTSTHKSTNEPTNEQKHGFTNSATIYLIFAQNVSASQLSLISPVTKCNILRITITHNTFFGVNYETNLLINYQTNWFRNTHG